MRTGSKLGIFGLGAVALFSFAAAAGAALGPIDVGSSASHSASDHTTNSAIGELSGLSVAAGGFQLVPSVDHIADSAPSTFVFRIDTSTGVVLTKFELLHERRLHLIVLSRNLVDYLHVHPTMDSDGSWRVAVPPLNPGSYRVYADFQPTGSERITLGSDLQVPGPVPTVALPPMSPTAETDGYQVAMSGVPIVGSSTLNFDVSHNGQSLATDPYLGAAGHLVVIRAGDLGYLHVHPSDGPDPTVRFVAEFPTPGTYRLFFDFSHDGAVHTASFTIEVPTS